MSLPKMQVVLFTKLKMLMCTVFGCTVFSIPPLVYAQFEPWHEDVGYAKLVNILGTSAPNGSGVPVSLVEAAEGANGPYFPDTTNTQFSSATDPLGVAVTFIDGSGGMSRGTSTHSQSQTQAIIGNSLGLAPAANSLTVYEANNYLTHVLNQNSGNTTEPDTQNFRVQNFSWQGTLSSTSEDREALRRFDFVINRDNITAAVGLNNNTNALPTLLSHGYNSIAVGRQDGGHSSGLTHLSGYGPGRSKPDLVGPLLSTSGSTSSVSSAATLLHSSSAVVGTDAANSQTMKAILLAGAEKEFDVRNADRQIVSTFSGWSQFDSGGVWHPLDDTYGAGQLNVFNSFLVAESGQAVGSTSVPTQVGRHGWDYQTIQPGLGNELLYDFVIPAGSTAEELSIVLTWNALIEDPMSSPINFSTGNLLVADLALELVDDQGVTVDLTLGDGHSDGLSDSAVDNVEHIYLENLAAGTYTLKVSSNDIAADFGLAWRTSTLFDTFSADFDSDGDVDGADFLTWQRGRGTLINATFADGDANGDGTIDEDDFAIYSAASLAAEGELLSSAIFAVPEPTTTGVLAIGFVLVLSSRYRQAMCRAL